MNKTSGSWYDLHDRMMEYRRSRKITVCQFLQMFECPIKSYETFIPYLYPSGRQMVPHKDSLPGQAVLKFLSECDLRVKKKIPPSDDFDIMIDRYYSLEDHPKGLYYCLFHRSDGKIFLDVYHDPNADLDVIKRMIKEYLLKDLTIEPIIGFHVIEWF